MDPIENIKKLFEKDYVESPLIESFEVGQLPLPSGKLVASDPVLFSDLPAFDLELPKGSYPVILHKEIATDCVAYLEIQFQKGLASEWSLATLPGQDLLELQEGEIYGFPVESGMAAVMDSETQKDLGALEAELFEKKGDDFMGIYEEFFHEHFFSESGAMGHYALLETGKSKDSVLLAFQAGYGEGFYGTYLGRDKNGQVIKAVIEFIEIGA